MSTDKTDNELDAKMAALQKTEEKPEKIVDSPLDQISGWIDYDRTKISYGGRLYPASYRFQVSTAKSKTIKYFSTLDENNPASINDALTYVVQQHVRILDGNRVLDPLEVIYEHDRLFFVMVVHQYSGAPTSLSFKDKCPEKTCRHKQDVNITATGLQYKPYSDKAYSYLNEAEGHFVISTKSMGTRTYRPLTLKESNEMLEFTIKASQSGDEEIEKLFVKVASFFMVGKGLMKPEQIYQKYLHVSGDPKEVSLMLKILELVMPEQVLEVEHDCEKCKRPFRSKISSVAGLGSIFLVHDIDDELS